MLVLSRRLNEKIVLPGVKTSVQVVAIKGGAVCLGIEAPPEVTILREEVQARTAQWQPLAGRTAAAAARHRDAPMRDGLKAASLSLGLARLQLRVGQTEELQKTLDTIHEEIQRLRRGLDGGKAKAMPRPTTRPGNGPRPGSNRGACELLAGCAG